MAKKIEDRAIRKLTKTGGGKSISVTIPIEYVRDLKWREHQKVVITKHGSTLKIKDWGR